MPKSTKSQGSEAVILKVRSSSRLVIKPPPASATGSDHDKKSTAVSISASDCLRQRPLLYRNSKPGRDIEFKRGHQPKPTDFDSELFDLYQYEDLSLKEATAAIPKNVLPSDFWFHQKYAHNLSSRYENKKADFARQHDPRMDRVDRRDVQVDSRTCDMALSKKKSKKNT